MGQLGGSPLKLAGPAISQCKRLAPGMSGELRHSPRRESLGNSASIGPLGRLARLQIGDVAIAHCR